MNKTKNNPKGREDQAQPESKTPPSACEAKSLAPNIESILDEISNINGALKGVKSELATLAGKPDVDLSPISTFIGAVETGFNALSTDIQALTQAQANAASKEDLEGLASKSDIDQIKQMLAGIGFEMGGMKAGVSGLHTKVDAVGGDTSEIKAGISRIELALDELIDGMNAVIGNLHAIRESLDALEVKVDCVNDAVADVKKDTQYIPALSESFGKFNTAFDGIVTLLFSAIAAVPGQAAERMERKLGGIVENVNKIARESAKANKGLQAILECGTELTENLNAAGQKVRGIASMAEAKVTGIAEEGVIAAREEFMNQVQGWIDPMIVMVKDKLSDQEFIQMAGSVEKNVEILASNSKVIAELAEILPDDIKELLEIVSKLHDAKVFTYAEFTEITENIKSSYNEISGHFVGISKKTEDTDKNVGKLKQSVVDLVDQVSKTSNAALISTLSSHLNGMAQNIAGIVYAELKGDLPAMILEAFGEIAVSDKDKSITP